MGSLFHFLPIFLIPTITTALNIPRAALDQNDDGPTITVITPSTSLFNPSSTSGLLILDLDTIAGPSVVQTPSPLSNTKVDISLVSELTFQVPIATIEVSGNSVVSSILEIANEAMTNKVADRLAPTTLTASPISEIPTSTDIVTQIIIPGATTSDDAENNIKHEPACTEDGTKELLYSTPLDRFIDIAKKKKPTCFNWASPGCKELPIYLSRFGNFSRSCQRYDFGFHNYFFLLNADDYSTGPAVFYPGDKKYAADQKVLKVLDVFYRIKRQLGRDMVEECQVNYINNDVSQKECQAAVKHYFFERFHPNNARKELDIQIGRIGLL